MTPDDKALRERVRQSWRRAGERRAPNFGDAWQAAAQRHATSRRRYAGVAAAAVVAAVIAVATGVRPPTPETGYIELADLLGTTHWSAPSDVLIPEREFDIYQELPALFEST